MGIFNMDGPFYKIGSIVADILILGLLWFLLALPIFTIGASTSAVYYVFTKRVNGREGYVWSDFWRSFRQNFFTATAVWMTLLLIYIVQSFIIMNIGLLGNMANFVLITQFVILVQMAFITMYAFPLISRFEMGYREIFKTAFFMANRHILLTIANVILLALSVVTAFVQPAFILVAAGVYCYFSSFIMMKAFKKYRPDIDAETNLGELAPLQLDAVKEEEEDNKVDTEAAHSHTEHNEDEAYPCHYDNNSTVLNLERLKNIQEDKE